MSQQNQNRFKQSAGQLIGKMRGETIKVDEETGQSAIFVKGGKKTGSNRTRSRINIAMIAFFGLYLVVGGRLVSYGMQNPEIVASVQAPNRLLASRPDVLDRHGEILATDIRTVSLFAEPHRVVDPDEVIEELVQVLPDLDVKEIHGKLSSKSQFQWLRRQLTPGQQSEILARGIPGIGFRPENRRFYPGGTTASHVIGHVDIDNVGIAGMEKYIDGQGLADLASVGLNIDTKMEPVKLSIDLRVQHVLRDELSAAMDRYKAIASAGVVLDIHTGEVLAMASLPDFDPNNPVDAVKPEHLNRMTGGTYEMGSTFKAFTTAMALDSGKVSMSSTFDARRPIRIGGHTISDFHGKNRVLSVPEIFIYSSNIGTAKMADVVGIEGHQEFLTRLGLLTRMETEIPEVARPSQPSKWKKVNSVTISFGHGVATTPLQTAVAAAALMNGGKLIPPTFLPRSEAQTQDLARQVVSDQTSRSMRKLMRMNVLKGSGKRAEVPGYWVGGKTGTAEKLVNGRYSNDVRFNAFLSAFPVYDPQYVVLVVVDEPKPEEGQKYATAGMNAAPVVGSVIRRSAAMLGVRPKLSQNDDVLITSY